jgi:hypothetical protein
MKMKALQRRILGNESTTWLNFKLPTALHETLRGIAWGEGKSVSLLLTELINKFISERTGGGEK